MAIKKLFKKSSKKSSKPAAKKPAKKVAKKAVAKKPAPKKKSVVKEAKELGLIYVGSNRYANTEGDVTHLNEDGVLVPIN